MKIKSSIYSFILMGLLFPIMCMGQGKDYTFCYGSISVTLKDGGSAVMNRYGVNGQLIKSVSGEWTPYGSPNDMPGQTIRIQYDVSDELFSYTMIRSGYGVPSVLIDGEGRRYTLCKSTDSSKQNEPDRTEENIKKWKKEDDSMKKFEEAHPIAPMSKFPGFYLTEDNEYELEIKEIPYTMTKDESINYKPNEKKISLKLILAIKGVQIFEGICYRRGQSSYSWTTWAQFKTGTWNYMVTLINNDEQIELDRYSAKDGHDMEFNKFLNRVDANEFQSKINEYSEKVKNSNVEEVKSEILSQSDEMPMFPGGEVALRTYLNENIKYPIYSKEKKIEGKVIIKFCVTKEGLISQISIVRGVDPDLDSEAIRVIKTLPKFQPGKQSGVPVNVWYMAPVDFVVKKEQVTNTTDKPKISDDVEKVNSVTLNSDKGVAKKQEQTNGNNSSIINPLDGLVSYYPFNGNANDESGNRNNGIIVGATLTTDRKGNPNSAYYFDGVSNYIKVLFNSILNTQRYTISVWVNVERFKGSDAEGGYILSKGIYPNYNYVLAAGNLSGTNTFGVGTTVNGNYVGFQSTNTFQTNNWYLFVVTNDGSILKTYINSVLNGSLPVGTSQTNNHDIYIGRYEGSTLWNFKGKIDDIRIYNRALNENEISSLFNEK